MISNFVRTKNSLLVILTVLTFPLCAMDFQYTRLPKPQCIYFSASVLEKEQKNMALFCEQHTPTITSDLTRLAQKTTDGCTRGLMRKLAHGVEFKNMLIQLIGKRRATILSCNKDPEKSLHCNKTCLADDGRLSLWLWAHRKCKNNSLKQYAQLVCVDPSLVTQTLQLLAYQNSQYGWLLEKRVKKK